MFCGLLTKKALHYRVLKIARTGWFEIGRCELDAHSIVQILTCEL